MANWEEETQRRIDSSITGKTGTDRGNTAADFVGTICAVQGASTITEQFVGPRHTEMPVDGAVRRTREFIDQLYGNLGQQAVSEVEPEFGE